MGNNGTAPAGLGVNSQPALNEGSKAMATDTRDTLENLDAIVCGGGPAGSTFATTLARKVRDVLDQTPVGCELEVGSG